MNSSQRALLTLGALWLVATLSLTSAQLRVLAGPPPRGRRYLVAWLVCTLLFGGLLSYLDQVTGRARMTASLYNFGLAGILSGVALTAGGFVERNSRSARFLRLVLLHGLIVLLAYPFI